MRKTDLFKKGKKGLTLLELMITVFVLSIGIMSCLLFFVTSITSTELAKDTTVATTHAEYLMEEMRSRTTLAAITSENWATWASTNGLNTLPSETITVAYADQGADPLNITTTINWTRRTKSNNMSFTTELTK